MKKNVTLLAGILGFVLLLGGAYLLYDKLSREAAPDQLMVQSGAQLPASTSPQPSPEPAGPEPAPETASPEQPPVSAAPEQPTPGASPEQPPVSASPEQPAPSAAPEQPTPSAGSEQPAPSAAPEQPTPSAVPEQPSPSVAPEQPAPSAAPEQPTPSAVPEPTPEPSPSPEPSPEETGGGDEVDAALAPDFTVYDRDGNPVRLSDFVGKPVVLNFWASWCGPCKRELPDFNEAYLELGEEVQFLMVNLTTSSWETQENAAALIDEMGYTFPVFYDLDGDAAVTYRTYSIPTTYFIDAQGRGIAQATGAIDRDTLNRGIGMIYSP